MIHAKIFSYMTFVTLVTRSWLIGHRMNLVKSHIYIQGTKMVPETCVTEVYQKRVLQKKCLSQLASDLELLSKVSSLVT